MHVHAASEKQSCIIYTMQNNFASTAYKTISSSRRGSLASGVSRPLLDTEENYVAGVIPEFPPSFGSTVTDMEVISIVQSRTTEMDFKEGETTAWQEVTILGKYSIPLIISFLLQYSLTVASVFSVGRLGKAELAAVSLASMTANISAYSIIQGISTCLDTLCPQAYGRGDLHMVGVHFLRCTYFLGFLYIPIFIVWVFLSEPILNLLISDPALCALASRYLQVLALGLPAFVLFENLKHFLQAQGIFHASTYVLMVCAPLNLFLNFALVWWPKIGLGFIGAPTAVVLTNWTMAMMLLFYTVNVAGSECWCGFTKLAFQDWSRMIHLALPGVLMVEAEWLAFEILTFSASRFGTVVLATQSVVSTTCVLMYQIPFAVSIAASTRIAWLIGSKSKASAQMAARITIYCGLVMGVFSAIFLALFRYHIAALFSSDNDVLQLAGKVLILGAIYQVNDFLAAMTGGVLRGQGRQKIGGFLNLFSYYVIALPVAFLLAFHFKMELMGLWIGMVVALLFISLLQTYFVVISDWDYIISES